MSLGFPNYYRGRALGPCCYAHSSFRSIWDLSDWCSFPPSFLTFDFSLRPIPMTYLPFSSSWLPPGTFCDLPSRFSSTPSVDNNNCPHPPISAHGKQHHVWPHPSNPLASIRATPVRSRTRHPRFPSHVHSLPACRQCNGTHITVIYPMAR